MEASDKPSYAYEKSLWYKMSSELFDVIIIGAGKATLSLECFRIH
jgi:hypothetical protein